FSRLSRNANGFAATLVKLAFLEEHGMLPESAAGNPESVRVMEDMLLAATGATPIPDLPEEYLVRFSHWVDAVCMRYGFATRDFGERFFNH
ncbi:MAG: hypothetical protein KAG97_01890, partial [Victivallales bacterium]|nr:hypothetical protein [Victivallales bacterium]